MQIQRCPQRPDGTIASLIRCLTLPVLAIGVSGCQKSDPGSQTPQSVGGTANVDQAAGIDVATKFQTAVTRFRRNELDRSLEVVREVLIASPDHLEACSLAMELCKQTGKFCEAGEFAVKLAQTDPSNAANWLIRGFDSFLRCGNVGEAEVTLRRGIEMAPNDTQIHRLLAQLYNAQGRRFEASEHVRHLIRLRAVTPDEILSLIDLQGPFLLVSFDEFAQDSDTSLFTLGKARDQYVKLNVPPAEVLRLLEPVVKQHPNNTALAAFNGRILAESARQTEFQQWLGQVPSGIQDQPEYWSAVGNWLEQEGRNEESIRAYGEALRRDPTDRESLRTIIHMLGLLGKEDQTPELRQRLAVLDQIFRIAKDADAEQALWISQRLQELVRPWESAAWLMHSAQLAGQLQQQVPQLNQRQATIVQWESGASPARIRDARLERLLGFSIDQWPMPQLDAATHGAGSRDEIASGRIGTQPQVTGPLDMGMRLTDVASVVGIAVQVESGFPVDGGEFLAYQVNGSGLAALDYDLDGRIDLYVVQAGGPPVDPIGSLPNHLFRLLPEQRYQEVTEFTQTGDRGYGQGVCAGDVNQDGFPDLLVANIGRNTLYINQGDGTFREASELIIENRDTWTSCIALADLDGDHLPELIEVNYVDDPEAYVVKCDANYLPCQPQRFQSAADRVYRLQEDGTFSLWEPTARMSAEPKLGFGIVVANFDRQHGNDFFIANDGDLNHYWTSTPSSDSRGPPFTIVESAGLRGCSIGRGGDSQACMGVASGDFNRDGTLDLHVTNFHHEPVNLFLQTKSGFFADEALKYRLVEPSFPVLGFGTQAIDLDNDGWLDLAVLNGHVFDASKQGIPFRMRPQLFRGSQSGFTLHDADSAGAYWGRRQLGRTMAVLDWNRDGRMDLVCNHLDVPVALLQNECAAQQWLQLELIGVECERDAIGAEAVIDIAGTQWTAWQTGGDGYMCTNEPVLHFGMGQAQRVDRLLVTWPNGRVQTFENLRTNCRYLLVEGEEALFER